MTTSAKSKATTLNKGLRRAEAARKKIAKAVKRGHVFKGPALHRLRIKA